MVGSWSWQVHLWAAVIWCREGGQRNEWRGNIPSLVGQKMKRFKQILKSTSNVKVFNYQTFNLIMWNFFLLILIILAAYFLWFGEIYRATVLLKPFLIWKQTQRLFEDVWQNNSAVCVPKFIKKLKKTWFIRGKYLCKHFFKNKYFFHFLFMQISLFMQKSVSHWHTRCFVFFLQFFVQILLLIVCKSNNFLPASLPFQLFLFGW